MYEYTTYDMMSYLLYWYSKRYNVSRWLAIRFMHLNNYSSSSSPLFNCDFNALFIILAQTRRRYTKLYGVGFGSYTFYEV